MHQFVHVQCFCETFLGSWHSSGCYFSTSIDLFRRVTKHTPLQQKHCTTLAAGSPSEQDNRTKSPRWWNKPDPRRFLDAIHKTQRIKSQCQRCKDTFRGPVSMPQQVRAVLAAQGESAQYLAGGFNVMADQCTFVMSKYAWHEPKHWPHHSIYIMTQKFNINHQTERVTHTHAHIHTTSTQEKKVGRKKRSSHFHVLHLKSDPWHNWEIILWFMLSSQPLQVCVTLTFAYNQKIHDHPYARTHAHFLHALSCSLRVFQPPDGSPLHMLQSWAVYVRRCSWFAVVSTLRGGETSPLPAGGPSLWVMGRGPLVMCDNVQHNSSDVTLLSGILWS